MSATRWVSICTADQWATSIPRATDISTTGVASAAISAMAPWQSRPKHRPPRRRPLPHLVHVPIIGIPSARR